MTVDLKDICYPIKSIQDHIDSLKHTYKVVLLYGDLSAGKTTLVSKYCQNQGLAIEVSSPTFSLMHEYGNNIYHYDLYRKSWNEVVSIGILDLISQEGIHFIEWSKEELANMLKQYNQRHISVKITPRDDQRHYDIETIA